MDFKASLYDSNGNGITGSTALKLMVRRDLDGYFFDFSSNIFKNSGWITKQATLTDIDIVNIPGEYKYSVTVTAWQNGTYSCFINYTSTPKWTSSGEFLLVGGIEASNVGYLSSQAKSDVNTEMLDVLNVDTFDEPGKETPISNTTLAKKLGYLYKFLRNKITTSGDINQISIYNDAGTIIDQKAIIADNGTMFTREKITSG